MQKQSKVSLLEFIQKHATIGTWEYDVELDSVHWSSETKKIHEVSVDFEPKVESGISFYRIGYSRTTITKLFTNCIEKHEDFDIELEIVTPLGINKWVRVIGMPIIENYKCCKVQGLFQDIDEKTKNSIALNFKEKQLRQTFESALIGMAIIDLEGNWINVNRSLCKTFGYSTEELMSLSFTDITHPEDLKKGYKSRFDMINGKLDDYETEKRFLDKKGDTIWTQLSTSIVRDDNGQPLHFVAQISDISQIKKSSNKVNQLLKTTENQNKRLLNFAHIVSHNLRSHYANLDMLLDIVKIDLPETTENEVFPLILEAVNNLGETVENLNEVASINIKTDNIIESLNLSDYLNKAKKSIAAIILDSKSIIEIDVNKDLQILGIPAYLDSIILNFLTNAIKYKKPNEPAKIDISTDITDKKIVLKIKDNGQGIDLEKYGEKLFGMYKTFHRHEDSRGLGLFITKNQVEAIGGKIEVKSKVNEGTTFYIHLNKYE
ncbi:sensor histidine kinase [Psychroserpens luteus]|uniref:histidine kinase n=1 Tax=Psychroserpens luteus TaxID=1434066 RepID=A0ABW5ZYD9_9FLAO|nr:HAMP domain-containing sensor histidine kinase [Psychroserpens luteus]